ncbi:MAG: alpha-ketoacid dehydrogenase subunit beta [Methanomassiliicoccales archaeon]
MKMNMVSALNQALLQEMGNDDSTVLIGEDVGVDGGVFRVTQGLIEEYGSRRVIDSPLSESGIIGVSVGMAMNGLRPIAEMQFMGFSYLGINQMIAHAARMRNRTRGRLTVPMVLRMPYGGGVKALEHHSESTESLYVQVPGQKVVVPSTPKEAKGLLISSIRDPDPVVFLEPKRNYRLMKEEVPEEEFTTPLGEARVVAEGDDVTIVGWGAMIPRIQKAMEGREESAEIIDMRTLSPMDTGTVISSVKRTGRAMVVHEAPMTCGVGAEISARIHERAILHLEAPVVRVTAPDITVPLPQSEDYYYIGTDRISDGLNRVMEF